jgi:hypothetical protein
MRQRAYEICLARIANQGFYVVALPEKCLLMQIHMDGYGVYQDFEQDM